MSITGSLVVFVCLWWIVFFSLLPIDVNREKKGNIEGIDPGAPENPKIFKKITENDVLHPIPNLSRLHLNGRHGHVDNSVNYMSVHSLQNES